MLHQACRLPFLRNTGGFLLDTTWVLWKALRTAKPQEATRKVLAHSLRSRARLRRELGGRSLRRSPLFGVISPCGLNSSYIQSVGGA